jgi:hypothetical protein
MELCKTANFDDDDGHRHRAVHYYNGGSGSPPPPPIFVLPVFWKVEPRVKKPQAILINLDSVQKPTA